MDKKMNAASSLVEVVDRILDTVIVIDKFLAFLQSRSIPIELTKQDARIGENGS